jgi:hypothetical protein
MSGLCIFLKLTNGGSSINGCNFVAGPNPVGITQYLVTAQGFGTNVGITNNRMIPGFSSTYATEVAFMFGGLNNGYPARERFFVNNRITQPSGVNFVPSYQVYGKSDVYPIGNDAAPSATVTTVTGVATTTVYSTSILGAVLLSGHGFKLHTWGTRTGAVGVKSASLVLTAGATVVTIALTGAVTAADTWSSEIVYYGRDIGSQSINTRTINGSSALNLRNISSQQLGTYDLLVELIITVATAAETMTVDGLLLDIF